MRYLLSLAALLFGTLFSLQAQGTAYVLKGGPTMGQQQWNNFERDPLFTYHGAIAVESLSETDQFSLFAQLGLHNKGSAIIYRGALRNLNGDFVNPPNDRFIFRNLSLILGGKSRFLVQSNLRAYYLIGLRADYTIDTNLDEYEQFNEINGFNPLFYPTDQFVREFNYGLTLGGGVEFPFSEFIMGVIEFNVHPDLSLQYEQFAVDNVYNPITGTNNTTIPERRIRNVAFELSFGVRLLRKVEYID